MKDLEQQKLDQIIKSAGLTEGQNPKHGESPHYKVGYQDAMDNEGDDMSWLKTHWQEGENSHQYRRGYADGIEAYNNGLTEMNPDGTISDDEPMRRDDLLASFESEFHDLLAKAQTEAQEIGGDFRSPAIMAEVKNIMIRHIREMM